MGGRFGVLEQAVDLDRLGAALELKSVDISQRIISGYAAVSGNLDRVGDIIDPGAFTKALATKVPADIAVFIGHKTDTLPVGIPLVVQPDGKGLYTETLIKGGPVGDDLLETAAFLQRHGRSLGMSIGYRARQSKMERVNGSLVRRLTDVDVMEYSFAAPQSIANPEALVVGVKTDEAADNDTQDTPPLPVERSTPVKTLPDSAFLYIAPGGVLDDEGKTTPSRLRQFPYRDAEGAVDVPALRDAVTALVASPPPDLDTTDAHRLAGRAQRLLADATTGQKTLAAEAPEWQQGAVPMVAYLGYALLAAADELAASQKAMTLLGEDTKAGARMQGPMRAKLREAIQTLTDIVNWAETVDAEKDAMAKVALYRRQMELQQLDLVAS